MRPPRASLRANSCLRSEISLTYRLEIISNRQHVRLSCLVEFSFISSAGQLWACIPRKPKSWKNDLFVLAKSNFLLIIAVVFRHLTHWANLNAPIYPWEGHQKAHPTSFFETQCMEVALWLGIIVFPVYILVIELPVGFSKQKTCILCIGFWCYNKNLRVLCCTIYSP